MSEAPKKIWYDLYSFEGGLEKLSQHDTQYIRADLVDGLVKSLEEVLSSWEDGYRTSEDQSTYQEAQAALAALKEEG